MSNPLHEATSADLCIHAANVCYLLSYLTRDMLVLRVMTCLGLGMGIVYFTCGSAPDTACTTWQATFLVINLVQILRLLRYRERVQLNEEEEALSEEAFEHLTREELADLLTRSVRVGTRQLQPADPTELTEGALSEDEIVLRDMAFSPLSRADLLNLVTRRFHGTAYSLTPGRVRSWTARRKRRLRRWMDRRIERPDAAATDPQIPAPPAADDPAMAETVMPDEFPKNW